MTVKFVLLLIMPIDYLALAISILWIVMTCLLNDLFVFLLADSYRRSCVLYYLKPTFLHIGN